MFEHVEGETSRRVAGGRGVELDAEKLLDGGSGGMYEVAFAVLDSYRV